jgi:hypothetical protein
VRKNNLINQFRMQLRSILNWRRGGSVKQQASSGKLLEKKI